MTDYANQIVELTTMPWSSLRIDDPRFKNPREYSGLKQPDIRELALDIVRRGVLVPLIATADGLVIAGSRRWRALAALHAVAAMARLRGERPDWNQESHWFWVEVDGPVDPPGVERILDRIDAVLAEVPIAVAHPAVGDREGLARLEGLALADNVLRVELTSYEVASRLTILHETGATGAQLARLIGKSASYVSRKLSTWRHAGPELKAAWKDGMAEDSVISLSQLPVDEQARVLAGPIPRGRRGPAHRPSVDMVRETVENMAKWMLAEPRTASAEIAFKNGAISALRWVLGESTDTLLANWMREVES